MITKNKQGERRRGRPRGASEKGARRKSFLYATALGLFASQGYEATTLRQVASAAGVSSSLMYRYFPSKRAIVLEFYESLSTEFASKAAFASGAGDWASRATIALRASLETLRPHRSVLRALTPMLVSSEGEGLLAPSTSASRHMVQQVFINAVTEAANAPVPRRAMALGRLAYLLHLAMILFWLLDLTPEQQATRDMVDQIEKVMPRVGLLLRLPGVWKSVLAIEAIAAAGLLPGD